MNQRHKHISILYLVTELDVGGAEKMLYQVARAAHKGGYRVRVACLTGEGQMGDWLKEAGIPTESLGMRGRLDLRVVWRLLSLMKRVRPDILHCFLFHANFIGRLVGRLARIPVIIGSVQVEEPRRHHLWLDRVSAWATDVEHCVSDSVAKYTHERSGIPQDKLVTIKNGVEIPPTMTVIERRRILERAGIPPEARVVASVGRLERQKGMDVLLAAFKRVVAEVPGAWLLIAGHGPQRGWLEDRARVLGVASNVAFLGFEPEISRMLGAMDVFVLASRWEGLPNVLLEAMAAGRPVVATSVGGIPETVKDGVRGILVPPEDEGKLAGAIIELLRNGAKAEVLGREAQRFVRENLSIENMWEETESLYLGLMRRKGLLG